MIEALIHHKIDPDAAKQKLAKKSLRPETEIDNMKICFLVEEAIEKIQFLSKINESEDNSSELAGFEINKLLKKQLNLEKEYANLIKKRSRLKGIANRTERAETETEIKYISKMLKESTKKLCRLFKENTNLDNDSNKVREERVKLYHALNDYIFALENNEMRTYVDLISDQLEEQNKLRDYMAKENELAGQIKVFFL
jgi:hypothetical protein